MNLKLLFKDKRLAVSQFTNFNFKIKRERPVKTSLLLIADLTGYQNLSGL